MILSILAGKTDTDGSTDQGEDFQKDRSASGWKAVRENGLHPDAGGVRDIGYPRFRKALAGRGGFGACDGPLGKPGKGWGKIAVVFERTGAGIGPRVRSLSPTMVPVSGHVRATARGGAGEIAGHSGGAGSQQEKQDQHGG